MDRYGFQLFDRQILLPESYRAELIELPSISAIANTPNHYLGVCNLRGNLIPCYQLSEGPHKYILIIGEQEPAAIAISDMAQRFHVTSDAISPSQTIDELFRRCGKYFYNASRQIEIDPEEFFLYLSNYRDTDLLNKLHSNCTVNTNNQ